MMKLKILSCLRKLLILIYSSLILTSCSVTKQISRSAKQSVLKDSSLLTAHIGISIYEPATGKYWFNHNGEKYFVPASNTKIPTCYAAMKYLGDSLVGLKYGIPEEKEWKDNTLIIQPTGDPTFLHPDFIEHPASYFLNDFFKTKRKKAGIYYDGSIVKKWGNGWSWNDYDETYMAERNLFPVFGNVLDIRLRKPEDRLNTNIDSLFQYVTGIFKTQSHYFDTLLNNHIPAIGNKSLLKKYPLVSIEREMDGNTFYIRPSSDSFVSKQIPFATRTTATTVDILSDTLKTKFNYLYNTTLKNQYEWVDAYGHIQILTINKWNKIHSQPTDSLLKPMMHRSDNFFAEQSLLMVSNELLGVMNDAKIIDTLLKTDLKDLPQKPRWVDGSGLSRYNLFTPQDFVVILNKMKNEFGMNRIKEVFPTGGEGTINSYYKADSGYIYAKTGTLSGVVALSGYLTTKKNRELIFSFLVNNHQASATAVRRAVEKFIQGLRGKY